MEIPKKKALIIGITGQIGQYLSEQLINQDYQVYGLARQLKTIHPNVIFTQGDINDHQQIETIIRTIMPHEIYNLASLTSIEETINNPLSTYQTNINSLINLCEIIKSIGSGSVKLLNANSSEIYRGNITDNQLSVIFNETETPCCPISPYGISKMSSYWIIKYYRDSFNLPFYTGIFCNIVSSKMNERYLFAKIIKHVKYHKNELLSVGNINLSKDFLHVSDVIDGIITIINCPQPASDYVISSGQAYSLKKIIEYVYQQQNITIKWIEDKGYDTITDQLLITSDPTLCRKYEKTGEVMIGNNTKLLGIGWKPKYNIESLIHELFMSM